MNEESREEKLRRIECMDLRSILEECQIPKYNWDAIELYLLDRIRPGDFLVAVFANDLSLAAMLGDAENKAALANFGMFTNQYLKELCHGSYKVVGDWLMGVGREKGPFRQARKVSD